MKFIIILAILFSTSSFAGKFDCLKNDANFTMSVNPDGTYNPDDSMGDIVFSLKGNGKYLVLDTRGPHYAWDPNGAYMVLKKKGSKFVSSQGNTIVHPFCSDEELYVEFKNSPSGGFFMGLIK